MTDNPQDEVAQKWPNTVHELKVLPPYFDALLSGAKTFEVRKNDRGFQRGDIVRLREWHAGETNSARPCTVDGCWYHTWAMGHWATAREPIERQVTFVLSADPRFGGIEPGYVVLGLRPVRLEA